MIYCSFLIFIIPKEVKELLKALNEAFFNIKIVNKKVKNIIKWKL